MPKRKKATTTAITAAPDGTRVMKTKEAVPQFFRGARLMVSEEEAERSVFEELPDLRQRLYLEALAEIPRLGRAAKKAGVSGIQAMAWRRKDQVFAQAFEVAYRMGLERAEGELWRRGIEGVEKPVYQQGKLVGTVREFDTTAAMFMLRGAMPEKYREKGGPEGSGSVSVGTVNNVHVTVGGLSTEEIEARLKQAAAALAPAVPVIDVGSKDE
jgi:hypothetical protein